MEALAARTEFVRTSDTQMVMTRTFEASARVMFEAWTKPEYVKRWWAPKSRGVMVSICEADIRVGGAWRYVLTRNGEVVCEFKGEYLLLEPPTRLEYTNFMVPFPDPVMTTVTFEEKDGVTLMRAVENYASKKILD